MTDTSKGPDFDFSDVAAHGQNAPGMAEYVGVLIRERDEARAKVAELEKSLQHARDAGPVMWTCDACGFSCDIGTEPLGTGDACMACENKELRATVASLTATLERLAVPEEVK